MTFLFILLGIFFLTGLICLLLDRAPKLATLVGVSGISAGSVIGLAGAFSVLIHGSPVSFKCPWPVPYMSLSFTVDALSAFFLIPIFFLSLLSAVYGAGYVTSWYGKKPIGPLWCFFSFLVGSMALVVTSSNALLFLMAWEIMTLASYFLVVYEDEKEHVREAGITYLIATHIGTAFLLVFFILLGTRKGSLDFDAFGGYGAGVSGILFLLALIGFGTKAGFIPFHVWLPEAHPAAPSHVSSLMSGVMIKTGIYGIARTIVFLGAAQCWWGWALICIGFVSGVLGVLFAIAQHDIKRLLAYHSVENIGIIAMGFGLGILGVSYNAPLVAVLGFSGGLLHVLNHAIFKGLLFLSAGSVVKAMGTHDIEDMGGILKKMPVTGATFITGAAAISGLPPFNGFVSEFLIYCGAFYGITQSPQIFVASVSVILGLALIGGLAAACFTKASGIMFLGEPRTDKAAKALESGFFMKAPIIALALSCLAIGVLPFIVIRLCLPVLPCLSSFGTGLITECIGKVYGPLLYIAVTAAVFFALLAAISLVRRNVLSRQGIKDGVTWDCGYSRPDARMQYTASSFAGPLMKFFNFFLQTKRHVTEPEGIFPDRSAFHSETPDIFLRCIYEPAYRLMSAGFSKLKWFQHGRLQAYILYVVVTLLLLLIWKLG